MIKIENGVMLQQDGTYKYSTTSVEGQQTVFFKATKGDVPEIGDFIVGGLLKKREGYQINNDGKLRWPSDNPNKQNPNNWNPDL